MAAPMTFTRDRIAGGPALLAVFLLYFAIIMPTHSLSSSLAIRNLDAPRREFAAVRLWGTIGWMAVGWVVSGVMLTLNGGQIQRAGAVGVYEVFWMAAALSVVLASVVFGVVVMTSKD